MASVGMVPPNYFLISWKKARELPLAFPLTISAISIRNDRQLLHSLIQQGLREAVVLQLPGQIIVIG